MYPQTCLKNAETILFIGDSITDCGRRDDPAGLGSGYVRFFTDLQMIREPEKDVRVLNRGVSGDTVLDLRDRWQQDALAHAPDWLVVKIGINDVHTFLRDDERSVDALMYEDVYRELLQQMREQRPAVNLVLVEPFYICLEQNAAPWQSSVLQILPGYLEVVRRLAGEFSARHVPLHTRFQELLRHQPAERFCPEPVHPNPTGHLVIAEAVYAALVLQGDAV